MHNSILERELDGHSRHGSGPLTWWRTLPAEDFSRSADIVEAAVASIAAVSNLAPPDLIASLATAVEEERASVWNELATHYLGQDMMQLGLCAEIAGSAAALSADLLDPFGLVLLLNLLSQPFSAKDPETRLSSAASWLGRRGVLLNRATLSRVEWYPAAEPDYDEIYPWPGEDE